MFNKREFKKQVKAKAKEVKLGIDEKEKDTKRELKKAKRIINLIGFSIIIITITYVFFIR